jgi:2-phospho-L-lactate transferase/gluconeogenesis factor (CofD/UPF0052 family)
MLRGLKLYSTNITAICNRLPITADHPGTLREELGMLPPGDIRNCILALAMPEPLLRRFVQLPVQRRPPVRPEASATCSSRR